MLGLAQRGSLYGSSKDQHRIDGKKENPNKRELFHTKRYQHNDGCCNPPTSRPYPCGAIGHDRHGAGHKTQQVSQPLEARVRLGDLGSKGHLQLPQVLPIPDEYQSKPEGNYDSKLHEDKNTNREKKQNKTSEKNILINSEVWRERNV